MNRKSTRNFILPKPLKADLHLHTAEDPLDSVRYTAKEIISRAADEGFEVLSITNHQIVTFSPELFFYAQTRGILLIPGVEVTIRRRHVLVLNPPPVKICSEFSHLSRLRRPETLIVAPHPYYPGTYSLNGHLLKYHHLFDALEYCHFYSPRINFNQKAIEVCQSHGFPLIGNSDAHFLSQFGTTYSLIYAEKNLESIFDAIRQKRIAVVTRPLTPLEMAWIARRFLRMKLRTRVVRRRPRPKFPSFAPFEGPPDRRAV
ncbi:MAG: PHP domain-containing protein [Thermodesulfobacteriota bacterium]